MKELIIAILIGLITLTSCAQPENPGKEKCGCIDYRFSSKDSAPIAHSYIGKQMIAFCGYQNEYSDGEKIGILSEDSSFIGCGYEIILCAENRSIYSLGEAYNDSIKLYGEHFEIYRMELFPNQYGEAYFPIPLFKIEFFENAEGIDSDTTIVIPQVYLSESYLSNLESKVNLAKANTENPTKHLDLQIHYLFLRAVSDNSSTSALVKAGPYDGYLAELHARFLRYMNLINE